MTGSGAPRAMAQYYGANATSNLTGPAPRLRQGDEHAESRDTFKASPAYPNPASRRVGREIETNRKSRDKLRSQMVQIEAVMKMLI